MQFRIESIKDSTFTVRHGLLCFKVFVRNDGFIIIPRQIWLDTEAYKAVVELIKSAHKAFEQEKESTINVSCTPISKNSDNTI